MSDETASPDEPRLHRWTQDGEEWACAAWGHGPFCRLCQRLDPDDENYATTLALFANVDAGLMEVNADSDGSFRFRLTEAGERRVELMIEGGKRAN